MPWLDFMIIFMPLAIISRAPYIPRLHTICTGWRLHATLHLDAYIYETHDMRLYVIVGRLYGAAFAFPRTYFRRHYLFQQYQLVNSSCRAK